MPEFDQDLKKVYVSRENSIDKRKQQNKILAMENELKRRQLELRKNELQVKYQMLEQRRAASQLEHREMNDFFIKPAEKHSGITSPMNNDFPPERPESALNEKVISVQDDLINKMMQRQRGRSGKPGRITIDDIQKQETAAMGQFNEQMA